MSGSSAKPHTSCRACGKPLGASYLHLGNQPLANALLRDPDEVEATYPLTVHLCKSCGLSQLSVVVDPQVLYGDYRFASGTTAAWHAHCEAFAKSQGTMPRGRFVVDIAANDGTQLFYFQEQGWRVLGVDPAPVPSSVPMYKACFDEIVAQEMVRDHGRADLVIAQNVLAHVDGVVGFLKGIESLLADGGTCVIEVPHVRDLITSGAFDTIYHEHLSYWTTSAVIRAARQAGLVLDVSETLKVHGGSRRFWLVRKNGGHDRPVLELPIDERPYLRFATEVERTLKETTKVLTQIEKQGKRLWAFGASAKGTVMLNALKAHGNTVWPECILDDTHAKQGMFSPGLHLPIYSPVWMQQPNTENVVCWILSWNWKDVLMGRAKALGFKGQFLVTCPKVELV